MNTSMTNNWHEANQQYLMAAVGVVREELERYRSCLDSQVAKNKPIRSESSIA